MKFKLMLAALIVFFAGFMLFSGSKSPEKPKPPVGGFSLLKGKPAMDFTLMTYDGKAFNLSQQKGKKVVLFFNEGIMCYPACWNQIAALGTDKRLNNEQVISANIVVDVKEQWDEAIKKMPQLGKGIILFDKGKSVSIQYDVLSLESSMHKGGMPGHTYIIIDASGIIRYTLDDPKMGIQNETLINELSKI